MPLPEDKKPVGDAPENGYPSASDAIEKVVGHKMKEMKGYVGARPGNVSGRSTAENDPVLAVKREKAVALRVAGFSYAKIGKALGLHRDTAYDLVMHEIQSVRYETQESVKDLRHIAHFRHENLINRLWLRALPNDPTEPMDLGAVDRILRTIAADARIMGFEAPTKHQVDVNQIQTSVALVVEMICRVIPDDYVPKVYDAVQTSMATLRQGQAREDAMSEVLEG